jgi:hypothetical protein
MSHNVKKLRFALPEEDAVSGLQVASALLTKYKGPEMEKPVIRPYTPVSDEGKQNNNAPKTFHADNGQILRATLTCSLSGIPMDRCLNTSTRCNLNKD